MRHRAAKAWRSHARIISALLLLALCLATSAFGASIADKQGKLTFRNGDLLFGNLKGINSTNGLNWERSDLKTPVEFRLDSIAEVEFPSRPVSRLAPTNACQVRFTTGDALAGNFIAMDDNSLQLATPYGGQLSLSRKHISSIVLFPPPASAVYSGPNGLEGWTHGKSVAAAQGDPGQWTYRDGAFYASKAASIARDLKLPDVATIEFDLSWKTSLRMAIALYCDSLQPVALAAKENEPDFGGFYSFQMNSYFFGQPPVVDMLAIKKNEPLRYLGQIVGSQALARIDRAHVELRVNKPNKSILLLINNTLVREWIDKEFVGVGTCMRFVHQGQGIVKLSNLRVAPWNGFVEVPPDHADPNVDSVFLEQSAGKTGKIKLVSDGKLSLATQGGEIQLPLSNVRQIQFPLPKSEPPKLQPNEARAFFAGGGSLVLEIENWEAQQVLVKSPIVGNAALNPAAITRIEFGQKP